MKKNLAGIIAVMCAFQMTAFADTLEEAVELLSAQHTSLTMNFEMSYELNKPMDFLGAMQEYYEEWNSPESEPVDYQMLMESLLDSKADMTMKLNSDDDFKKIEAEMTGNFFVPIKANDNLNITGDMSYGMWMDMDFTDSEKFKYEITMKSPFSRKYIHMDLAKMIKKSNPIENMPKYDKEDIEEFRLKAKELLKESLKDTAKVDKKGSKYIVSFDNDGFVSFVEKYFVGSVEIVKEMWKEYAEAGFEDIPDDALEIPEEVAEAIRSIKFLGDRGIVIEIDTAKGKISDMKILCDIDVNIYDILTVAGEEIPEYMTKDNSYISFLAQYDYNYIDIGSTTVTFPEINEDNCVYLYEEIEEEIQEDSYEYNEEYFYGGAIGLAVKGPFAQPYLGARGVMDDYSWSVSEYEYGYLEEIEILWDNGVVTINDTKDLLPFDSIVLNSLTDEAFVDNVKQELPWAEHKHILVREGTTYISPELAKVLVGAEISDYNIDFNANGEITDVRVYYGYPNPYYTPSTQEV